MSEEINVTNNEQSVVERPSFLTVLCILTFIGSGLGVLFSLLAVVGMGALMGSLGAFGTAFAGGTTYMIVSLLMAGASLFGALQMWKLQKTGFMIYAGAAALGIIMPIVFGLGFSFFTLVINGAFIGMYYMNLKYMK